MGLFGVVTDCGKHTQQFCTPITVSLQGYISFMVIPSFFCIVNNLMEVLDTLHKVHRASHVDSFDFSTLYTKIPHTLLLIIMAKLI